MSSLETSAFNLPVGLPIMIMSAGDVESALERILIRHGVIRPASEDEAAGPRDKEMTRRGVMRLLTGKGYQVKSYSALNKVLKAHGVAGVKRGKDLWYPTEAINSIPARA